MTKYGFKTVNNLAPKGDKITNIQANIQARSTKISGNSHSSL